MREEEKEPASEEMACTSEEVAEEAEDIESLKAALAEERAKAERYLANWQRTQADFDNYKKRAEQERNETAKFSNAMLILNLLPVLDDLERAFNSVSAKLAGLTWVEGIRLIYRKLQAALEAQGLSQIEAVGEPFDPTFHEAVMHGEGEEGKVIEEFQRGYKLYDRVIRPASVMVGKGKEETEENKEEKE